MACGRREEYGMHGSPTLQGLCAGLAAIPGRQWMKP